MLIVSRSVSIATVSDSLCSLKNERKPHFEYITIEDVSLLLQCTQILVFFHSQRCYTTSHTGTRINEQNRIPDYAFRRTHGLPLRKKTEDIKMGQCYMDIS